MVAVFWLRASLMARLSRRVGGVPRSPGGSFLGRRGGFVWSAWRKGLETGDRGGGLPGPWPGRGEAEPKAAATVDDAPGD